MVNFSAGICGVWTRVKEESIRLVRKGYDVRVFSSNFIKGSDKLASLEEQTEGLKITRFPATKLGGESYMYWKGGERKVLKALESFKPDLIISHSYRHTHSVIASKIAKKLGIKSFLVTHAPFANTSRTSLSRWYIQLFHDPFIGKSTLKRFDKIIAITKWELPYLSKLGVPKDKIVYIPNGIPEEFFSQKSAREENKILFLGRISPIKNLEVLIEAISLIKDKKIELEIVGPAEEDYLKKLKNLISELKLTNRIKFTGPVFNLKEKIAKIDSSKIFILPSKREAMPQALIESMARRKIVIASSNPGALDLISNGKNGFIFENGNIQDLAEKIDFALSKSHNDIKKKALESVKQFSWNKVIDKLDSIIKKEVRFS